MVFLNIYNPEREPFISASGKAPASFLVKSFNQFAKHLENINSLNLLMGETKNYNIKNISESSIAIDDDTKRNKLAIENELLVVFSGLLNSLIKNDMEIISNEINFANFSDASEQLKMMKINHQGKLSPNSAFEDKVKFLIPNIATMFYSVFGDISSQIKSSRLNDLIQPQIKEMLNYLICNELENKTNKGEDKLEFESVDSLINQNKQAYKTNFNSDYFGKINLYFE